MKQFRIDRLWILTAGAALLLAQVNSKPCHAQYIPPTDQPHQLGQKYIPAPTTAPVTDVRVPAPIGTWVEMRPTDSGALTVTGNGTLTLTGNTTYRGDTTFVTAAPAQPVTYLGVSLDSIDVPLRTQLQIPDKMGLLVSWVDEQSSAKDLLSKYDVILRLDDQIIINADQFQSLIRMRKAGDQVTLHIVRNARPMDVVVKLTQKNLAAADVNGYLNLFSPQPVILDTSTGRIVPNAQFQELAAYNYTAAEPTTRPAAPPDRATIARRLYLDVTGQVPTPRQVEDFVNDQSPDAYQKLVDELIRHRPVVIQAPEQAPGQR